jgi:Leucine-rich repeat (LRR) protein
MIEEGLESLCHNKKLEILNMSINNIPLLEPVVELISSLPLLKTLDVYGNTFSSLLPASYHYRLCHVSSTLESLDGLSLKPGSLVRSRIDQLTQEVEVKRLIDKTSKQAEMWVEAERQVKAMALQVLT